MAGFFIAFEGIDGAGKLTQLLKTHEWLEGLGYSVGWSSEPNDRSSPIGQRIRSILRHEVPAPADAVEFQRMYVIDRAQDLFAFIQPRLEEGMIYLIERFGLSTIAYGMLSGASAEVFIKLHEAVLGPSMRWPDLTILLNCSVETAIRRRHAVSGESPQFFERFTLLERVREHYLALASHPYFRAGVAVVGGEPPADEVFEHVKKFIEPRLPRRA